MIKINCYSMIAAILILSFINRGSAENCTLDTINIGTERSGREIGGPPEWNVQVINNCDCPQKQIVLSCVGFLTAEPVAPSILSKQGDNCLVKNGSVLQPKTSVSFSYAWDPPFILLPHSSVVQCPTRFQLVVKTLTFSYSFLSMWRKKAPPLPLYHPLHSINTIGLTNAINIGFKSMPTIPFILILALTIFILTIIAPRASIRYSMSISHLFTPDTAINPSIQDLSTIIIHGFTKILA